MGLVTRTRALGLGQVRDQVAQRRGSGIGKVAAARALIELVFYGLRDGHIRRLTPTAAGTAHPWRGRRGSCLS